jgi:DNA-binding GntR family transcriptional regulator
MKRMQRQSSLRERCLVAIRTGIITGEIVPGTIWSVPAIAQKLGVSATPVREAMLDLQSEELVEPVPNRGFRVVELDDVGLDEIHAIRLMLEVPTVAAVTGDRELLTDAVVRRLHGLCDKLERHALSGDVAGIIETDVDFHSELLQLSGNRRLVELVRRLRTQTRRYGYLRADEATLLAAATDHRRIVEAVVGNDKRTTARVMEEHLAANRGFLAGPTDADGRPVAPVRARDRSAGADIAERRSSAG